jgi:hypothetical protein
VVDAIPVVQLSAPPLEAVPVASPPRSLDLPTPPRTTPATPRSAPVSQQVRSLLGKPQAAATAFVMREIFDRPLCRRRR